MKRRGGLFLLAIIFSFSAIFSTQSFAIGAGFKGLDKAATSNTSDSGYQHSAVYKANHAQDECNDTYGDPVSQARSDLLHLANTYTKTVPSNPDYRKPNFHNEARDPRFNDPQFLKAVGFVKCYDSNGRKIGGGSAFIGCPRDVNNGGRMYKQDRDTVFFAGHSMVSIKPDNLNEVATSCDFHLGGQKYKMKNLFTENTELWQLKRNGKPIMEGDDLGAVATLDSKRGKRLSDLVGCIPTVDETTNNEAGIKYHQAEGYFYEAVGFDPDFGEVRVGQPCHQGPMSRKQQPSWYDRSDRVHFCNIKDHYSGGPIIASTLYNGAKFTNATCVQTGHYSEDGVVSPIAEGPDSNIGVCAPIGGELLKKALEISADKEIASYSN